MQEIAKKGRICSDPQVRHESIRVRTHKNLTFNDEPGLETHEKERFLLETLEVTIFSATIHIHNSWIKISSI